VAVGQTGPNGSKAASLFASRQFFSWFFFIDLDLVAFLAHFSLRPVTLGLLRPSGPQACGRKMPPRQRIYDRAARLVCRRGTGPVGSGLPANAGLTHSCPMGTKSSESIDGSSPPYSATQ
jgi:hypothetical protein